MKKTDYTFDTENIEYLKTLPGGEEKVNTFVRVCKMKKDEMATAEERADYEMIGKCLTFMKKFGDNRWWASNDKRVLAYYQLVNKQVTLVPLDKLQKAVEFLLGRSVCTHEFAFNFDGLKEEAERAFNGNPYTEEEKSESIAKSLGRFANSQNNLIAVCI